MQSAWGLRNYTNSAVGSDVASEQSSCVLLYKSPLSENARTRIQIMRETTDGFEIAQRDLKLRGPGQLLGVRQAGEMVFPGGGPFPG